MHGADQSLFDIAQLAHAAGIKINRLNCTIPGGIDR